MRRRNLVTFIGALLLLWLPWMPAEVAAMLRAVAIVGLSLGGLVTGLACIPVKWIVDAFRLAVLGLGFWALRTGPIVGVAGGLAPFVFGAALLSCLSLAVGPMLAPRIRSFLYGSVLVSGWALIAAFIYATSSLGGMILPSIVMGFATSRFNRWRLTGRSSLVDALEQIQRDSRDTVQAFDSPAPLATTAIAKFQRVQLEMSMFWRTGPVLTQRIYQRIRKVCAKFPRTVISWQIAYAAALVIEDYPAAIRIVLEAQANGFDHILDDRILAYAMRAAYDPAWKSVLTRAWLKESSRPTLWTRQEFYSLSGDPTGAWRLEDPVFGRLQERLSVIPKSFEPPILRGATVSVSR